MRILNKIKKTISSCILCIRFPFLYPRNRFTNKHYNNWKIILFHRKWYKHTEDFFYIRFVKELPKNTTFLSSIYERCYSAHITDNKLIIEDFKSRKICYSKDISYFGEGTILKVGWLQQTIYIQVSEDWKDKKDAVHIITYVHAKWLHNLIKFLDWINDYPLQILHCIPTYTELDAMPEGWRKAFGIQMCKEVKAQLLKDGGRKLLREYRITQIKEKYGTLRWYCNWGSYSLYRILDRYEARSARTCIKCGKPAEVISTGWISPYCKDCIGNIDSISIEEYYNPSNYEDLETSKENIDS